MINNNAKAILSRLTAGFVTTACVAILYAPATAYAAPISLPENMSGYTESGGLKWMYKDWEKVHSYDTAAHRWGAALSYNDFLQYNTGHQVLVARSKYYNPNSLPTSHATGMSLLTASGDVNTIKYNYFGLNNVKQLNGMTDAQMNACYGAYVNAVYALYPSLKSGYDVSPEEIRYQIQAGAIQDKGIPYYCNAGQSLSTPSGGSANGCGQYTGVGAVPAGSSTTASTTSATAASASAAALQTAVTQLAAHPATVYNGKDYSKEFNAAYYYAANPDLQTAIGADANKLLAHYVQHGKAEGRKAIQK